MLSVLIATTKREPQLRGVLQSLSECAPPSPPWQIVIVENGPKRGAEAVVRSLSDRLPLLYFYHPWANKSNALNYALQHVSQGLILFSDDDVIFDPCFLSTYAQAYQSSMPGVFFGGLCRPVYDGPEPEQWLRPYLPTSIAEVSLVDADGSLKPRFHFLGFNWAAYTEDLRRTGGFDTRLGPGARPRSVGDEKAVQLQLLKNGCRRQFLKNAVVYHRVPPHHITPEYALRRIQWGGVRDGILRESNHHRLPDIAGRFLIQSAKWAAKTVLGKPKAAIFRTEYELRYALGCLLGRFRRWTHPRNHESSLSGACAEEPPAIP